MTADIPSEEIPATAGLTISTVDPQINGEGPLPTAVSDYFSEIGSPSPSKGLSTL